MMGNWRANSSKSNPKLAWLTVKMSDSLEQHFLSIACAAQDWLTIRSEEDKETEIGNIVDP